MIITTLATVVAASAVTGTRDAGRDRSVKRAIAAADAGLAAATYRINKLTPKRQECVVLGATSLTIEPVQVDGWCRAQTEDLGDGASYAYQVKGGAQVRVNGQVLIQRKIVSTGTVNGVTRRTVALMGSSTGISLFGGYAVISNDDFNMPNSTQIQGNTGSNGNIRLSNSAQICGNATVGPGKEFATYNSAQLCQGFAATAATEPFVLNPVDQGNAATVNNDGFIGTVDPWTLPLKITWNPATRYLKLDQASTLTLTGDVYSFCSLVIDNNAQLRIAPRAPDRPPLKIFIDAPENCPGVPNAGSIVYRNGAAITNLNADPTTAQVYLVGSTTVPTTLSFDNNFDAQVNMLIYAPRSTVSFSNRTHIVGAVAAKSVRMDNNTTIVWNAQADNVTVNDLLPFFSRQSYSECTAQNASATPDTGC